MSSPLIIKTCYTTSSGIDTRRFQLTEDIQQTPYQQIISLLESYYGIQNYSLKYKDDDGDMCSVGSQLELSEAFRVYTGKVLKLDVTVAPPVPTHTPTPSVFPSSSASTTSSIVTPPRSHVTDMDDDHDVISLDGSISDFEPDDMNRIPSPIPSDVFDPSIMSVPASHVDDDSDASLVSDMTASHISSGQTDIIHVDALDVLPPTQVEAPVDVDASIVSVPVVDVTPATVPVVDVSPVVVSPVVDVSPVPVVVDVTPVSAPVADEPVPTEQVIIPVDVTEPITESTSTATVPDEVKEVIDALETPSVIEPTPVIEPIATEQPGATTNTPVDVVSSPDMTPVPSYMTQSMTEQKYETPDEKHGQEWTCHACTFINVPQHGMTAISCEICGSPRIILSMTQHGVSTPIPTPAPRTSPLASVMAFVKDTAKDVIKAITPERTTPTTTTIPATPFKVVAPAPGPAPAPIPAQVSTPVISSPPVVTPVEAPAPVAPAPKPDLPIATVATSTTPAPIAPPVFIPPYIHHGWRCDGCNMAPIIGTRYKCTICPGSYDLCESCELAGIHDPSHIMVKMRAPPVDATPVPAPVPVYQPPHHRGYYPPHSMPHHHVMPPPPPPHMGLPPHFGGGHDMGFMGVHPYIPMTRPYYPHSSRPSPRPRAEFIASPTPDGFVVVLGTQQTVHKVWSLRNSGTIPWPRGAAFVHISGKLVPHDNDGSESIVTMLPECAPGAIVHIACDISVPQVIGRYRGHYRLMTVDRERFGPKVWVCIEVIEDKKEESKQEDAVVESSSPAAVLAVESSPTPVSVPVDVPVVTPTVVPEPASVPGPVPVAEVAPVSSPVVSPVESSPSATLAPPPFKYPTQLAQLQEMGFTQVDLCKWLLLNNNGDFNTVCEWLLRETK